ncbi:MAG: YIP1 family protein [Pseudomonadota bacterium]
MLNTFVDIFVGPVAAYQRLRERARFWIAFALIVLGSVALNYAYFALVDPEFLVEEFIAQAGPDLSNEEERGIREFASNRGAGGLLPALGSGASIIVFMLLHAGYYSLISMFSGHGIRYGQWLGLVCWSSLPVLLVIIAGFVALMIAPGYELPLNKLNPLSIANLLNMEITRESGAARVFSQLDISQIWTVVLLTIGYRVWTASGLAKSVAVAIGPYLLIYGIGIAFVVFS